MSKTPPLPQSKHELRKWYIQARCELSEQRRCEASQDARDVLAEALKKDTRPVLSFSSIGSELDLTPLNQWLVERGRLALPKVEGAQLSIWFVRDLEKDLSLGRFKIQEPIAGRCSQLTLPDLSCVLVPGVVFDQQKHRLGYGKGFYDKLLSQVEEIPSWGLGFKEQEFEGALPIETHDRPMSKLYLF